MRRALPLILAMAALIGSRPVNGADASAPSTGAPKTGAPNTIAPDAYTRIEQAYAPYLDKADPLGLPMKIRSLASDQYKFWRGSKDLFFLWAKDNCRDWLADEKAFLPNHGDLHLGNIGTYVTEEGLDQLGFGMVDFDDSARLPFELELLQGLITLDLVAGQNKIVLTPEQRSYIHDKLFESYRIAVNSRRNARELLKGDELVEKLISKAKKKTYADELDKFTRDGQFRPVVKKKDKLTDILDPVEPARYDAFAGAIAQAVKNDDRLAALMPDATPESVRKQIKHIVRRTRIDSSGSQGLEKYLILLDKPLTGVDHDIILYLKRQIPTAAERSGVAKPDGNGADARTPGQRCAQDMDKMTDPRAYLNSWAELEGKSFWVHFKEPFSDELDYGDVKDLAELERMAHLWATVVGATHREEGRFEEILPRLTPELKQQLRDRSASYLAFQGSAFQGFRDSPATAEMSAQTAKLIAEATSRGVVPKQH